MDNQMQAIPVKEARADAPASFVVYPVPQPASAIGKVGAFVLGCLTGIVGVAVAATVMDELDDSILDGKTNSADMSKDNDVTRLS